MNLDVFKIFKRVLPHFLRTELNFDFLRSVSGVLEQVNLLFQTARDATLYKLQFNGQTKSLEAVLNETFSPVIGGIFILNLNTFRGDFYHRKAEGKQKKYFYRKSEAKPKRYLYRKSEVSEISFIIKIPVSVTYNEIEVRNIADCYVIFGNKYTVETY